MHNNYKEIQSKLDKFRIKYAQFEVLKGIFYLIGISIALFTLLTIAELFLYFSVETKSILLLFTLLLVLISFVYFVVLPVYKIVINKKYVTDIDLAKRIATEFTEFEDSLQNTIELNEQYKGDSSNVLIDASIQQRATKLVNYNFEKAIHFGDLRNKLIVLFIFILLLSGSLIFISPIKNASLRLVDYQTNYSKPSPYTYEILNEKLTIGKGDNFKLVIRFKGINETDNVQIVYGNRNYNMVNDSSSIYSYQFNMVNNSIDFQFLTNNYYTGKYRLEVLPKPLLSELKSIIKKPAYTHLIDEELVNTTQLSIPEGSEIDFQFKAYDTDSIVMHLNDSTHIFISNDDNYFKANHQFLKSETFSIDLVNQYFAINDVATFDIEIIKDQYPSISVISINDSTDLTNVLFKGNINDDYGFTKLQFVTKINGVIDSVYDVNFNKQTIDQEFYYAFSFSKFKELSEPIEYYFQVKDNDYINRFKSAVSEVFFFKFPSDSEFFQHQDSAYSSVESVINRSKQLSQEIQNDLKTLQSKMINNELSDWERKSMIKNIYSKKERLEDVVKELQNKNEEINNYLNSFSEQNDELLKKQEQIQDLLDNVLSDELKEMMEELNEMMDKFNDAKMNELQQKMDISLDDLNKQLDKNLEVLRKMQLEQKLDQITEKVNEMMKKQEEFVQNQDEMSNSEIDQEQSQQKSNSEDLQKEYENLQELNKSIEQPFQMMDFNEEFNQIQQEFQKTIDENNKNNNRRSQNSAKQNLENIKNLASMLSQMQNSMFSQQEMANLDDIMQILDNLVLFSLEQEEVINSDRNSPFINQFLLKQEQLKQNFKIIEDSLYAVAKKEISLSTVVNQEIVNINTNFQSINSELSDGNNVNISRYQQSIMTSANNLALLLSEVIKQMQNQMANSQPGNQNCEKPGNNPNPNSSGSLMKQLQKSLQQQLGKMMQMMKEGASQSQMNKELGQALSKQEKMQNMLQQMMNQGDVGSSAYETLKKAEQLLGDVKNDLIRSNVNAETIERNEQILTRLLESEKAEQERGEEEKRKSNTAQEQYIETAQKYFENVSSTKFKEEKIIRNKLFLQDFYQVKYKNYVEQLDSLSGQGN